MAVRVEVLLHSGEPHGALHYFQPGDVIVGTVEVTAQSPVACRALVLRLIWHTEGAGEENVGTVAEQPLAEGSLPVGQPIHSGFHFQLPAGPWSYTGTCVSIAWAIEVRLDLPMMPEEVHRTRFIMRPHPPR